MPIGRARRNGAPYKHKSGSEPASPRGRDHEATEPQRCAPVAGADRWSAGAAKNCAYGDAEPDQLTRNQCSIRGGRDAARAVCRHRDRAYEGQISSGVEVATESSLSVAAGEVSVEPVACGSDGNDRGQGARRVSRSEDHRDKPKPGQRYRVGGREASGLPALLALNHAEVPVEHAPNRDPPYEPSDAGRLKLTPLTANQANPGPAERPCDAPKLRLPSKGRSPVSLGGRAFERRLAKCNPCGGPIATPAQLTQHVGCPAFTLCQGARRATLPSRSARAA